MACSGADPTPEAYFEALATELAAYSDAVDQRKAEYGEELSAELATLHERTDFSDLSSVEAYFGQAKEISIVKTADLFSDSAAALRSFLDELEALEPPDNLVEAHEDAVVSGEALVAAMPLTIEAVRNLDAVENLQESLEGSPYVVASQRFAVACRNLQDAAGAAGVEAELRCPDDLALDEGG